MDVNLFLFFEFELKIIFYSYIFFTKKLCILNYIVR